MQVRRDRAPVEQMLNTIERRVLEEVWIGASARRTMAVAATVLGVVAIAAWNHDTPLGADSGYNDWVPKAAAAAFLLAAGTSLLALFRKRFRWCCTAACVSAKSAATGFGALWWYCTTPNAETAWSTPLGCVGAVTLTATWLVVTFTPLDRSQPDMRARVATAD